MSTSSPPPLYYETSWSILSTIGLVNVLIGFVVIGITNFSPITLVPIIVSAANAIADGLCYYAFYANNPTTPTAIAAGFADVFWLIQEAGLSFYSYLILSRILSARDRTIFLSLFWILILSITTFKMMILGCRVRDILENSLSRVSLIDHFHIGYFISIALIESLSAYFLLRKFFSAKRSSKQVDSKVGLFRYLLRSTEIRLATLTLIGITRSITYSFQTTAQSATSVSGQVDRFVTTLECLFPVVMYVDILAAKSFMAQEQTQSSSRSRGGYDGPRARVADMKTPKGDWSGAGQGIYPMTNMETVVDTDGAVSSSQERIVSVVPMEARHLHSDSFEADGKGGGINKTVEFMFHDSGSPV